MVYELMLRGRGRDLTLFHFDNFLVPRLLLLFFLSAFLQAGNSVASGLASFIASNCTGAADVTIMKSYTCSLSDTEYSVSSNISNCEFIGCPRLKIQGILPSNLLVISNTRFINSSYTGYDIDGGGALLIRNTIGQISIDNSTFGGCQSNSNGSAVSIANITGWMDLKNSLFDSNTGVESSIYINRIQYGVLNIFNVVSLNNIASNGVDMWALNSSNLLISSLKKSGGGSIILDSITQLGPVFSQGSHNTFQDVYISNLISGSSALIVNSGSVTAVNLSINNVVALAPGSALQLTSNSNFTCSACTFSNGFSSETGGLLSVQSASSLTLSNGTKIFNGSALRQGGCVCLDSSSTLFADSVNVENCHTTNFNSKGGAFMVNNSSLFFTNTSIKDSQSYSGSAFYFTGISINSILNFVNVTGCATTSSSCIFFDCAYSTSTVSMSNSDVSGSIVQDAGSGSSCLDIQSNNTISSLSTIYDNPGYLSMNVSSNAETKGGIIIQNNGTLPAITLRYFDLYQEFGVSWYIVASTTFITPEDDKSSITDGKRNVIEKLTLLRNENFTIFDNIKISCQSHLQDSCSANLAFTLTSSLDHRYANLTQSVNVTLCKYEPVTLPKINVQVCPISSRLSNGLRCLCLILGSILVLYGLLMTGFSLAYRASNLYRFLLIEFTLLTLLGCILQFLSVILNYFIGMCMAIEWLDFMGFFLVNNSILMQIYRIQSMFLFTQEKNGLKRKKLSSTLMKLWYMFWTLLAILFMVVWSANDASVAASSGVIFTDAGGNAVIQMDMCSSQTDTYVMLNWVSRFIIEVVLLTFSFLVRKKSTHFDENIVLMNISATYFGFDVLYLILSLVPLPANSVYTVRFIARVVRTLVPPVVAITLLHTVKLIYILVPHQYNVKFPRVNVNLKRNNNGSLTGILRRNSKSNLTENSGGGRRFSNSSHKSSLNSSIMEF